MLTQFKDYIATHDLVAAHDKVLLAISGGLDSMVMLDLFREAGYEVGAAHANFGLRGKESDEDESFIKVYCAKHSIPFYSKGFSTKKYAEEKGISIQMAARDLRYAWFNQLLESEKYHWLATAHHLSDNLETVLLRWCSGAGLDQLTGIPRKNDRVVRPLLFAGREAISAYAKTKKISWREDASNNTSHYQRNFIRHQVIPKLKEINPSLEETFSGSLDKLDGALEQMQRGLGQLKDSIARSDGRNFLIDKGLLQLLRNPVFVCYEWLRPLGFDLDRCKQLVAALSSQSGARFLSSTHEAVVDREHIIVAPLDEAFQGILVEEGQDKVALGPWILTLHKERGQGISKDPFCATVDASRVRFPLLWRKWKSGDHFVPLGMKQQKKISDFLIDERVPMNEKTKVTVIESGGKIIWAAGYRVDDRFKVTKETDQVLVMQLRQLKRSN